MDRPWIFGIGEGKTGSCSLVAALRMLGLQAAHLGHPDNAHLRQLVDDNERDGKPITEGVTGLDALVEIQTHWRALDAQHPQARFILTYRPPDDAAISWARMVSARHHQFPRAWCDYETYATMHRRHISQVVSHFYGRPESLLILDARDDSATKWRLLCAFLNRPTVPASPYPHSFNHATWERANA